MQFNSFSLQESVCFDKKTFLLANSIFQVFPGKSLHASYEQGKTKFAKSFFSAFFFSSPIEKSSVSLLILFSTINFDTLVSARLFCFPVLSILLLIVLFIIFSLLSFYNRHLHIVFFEGYLFLLTFDDLGYTSKSIHQKFTEKNAFENFWLINVYPFHFLICFCFQTISQKNSGTNPLPHLINVGGCQNMCSFWFLLYPCFCSVDLGGRGNLKSLPLILWNFS